MTGAFYAIISGKYTKFYNIVVILELQIIRFYVRYKCTIMRRFHNFQHSIFHFLRTARIISNFVVSPLSAAMYGMSWNGFWLFGGDAMNRVSTNCFVANLSPTVVPNHSIHFHSHRAYFRRFGCAVVIFGLRASLAAKQGN